MRPRPSFRQRPRARRRRRPHRLTCMRLGFSVRLAAVAENLVTITIIDKLTQLSQRKAFHP